MFLLTSRLNLAVAILAKTELNVTEQQVDQLIAYVELLAKWNKAYNLTSVRNPSDMLVKHIMDSLMVGQCLEGNSFIDVGTGPGLPGIPLAILFPEGNSHIQIPFQF